jgi:subtilisin family serine protease
MKTIIIFTQVLLVTCMALCGPAVSAADSTYINDCGVLTQSDECVLWALDGDTTMYTLLTYAGFQVGDTVRVEGYIFDWPDTVCVDADGYIENYYINYCTSPPLDTIGGCGVLIQVDSCLLFALPGDTLLYELENYGYYQAGDSVQVVGYINWNCGTTCLGADACILGNSIGPCGEIPGSGFYVESFGIIVQGTECLLFTPAASMSKFYVLDNYADFLDGDTVFVTGSLVPGCQTVCQDADDCIENNTIEAASGDDPGYYYESYGILVQTVDCMLFAPQGHIDTPLDLENYADFHVGDTVFVTGNMVLGCATSCAEAYLCIETNTIDTLGIYANPVPGNVVMKLVPGADPQNELVFDGSEVVDSIVAENIYLIQFADSFEIDGYVNMILDHPNVILAEPNYEINLPENLQMSISFPDEYAPPLDIEHDEPAEFFEQASFGNLGIDSAQMISIGTDVIVAVIDNGFDLMHPWLVNGFHSSGYDYFNGDDNVASDSGIAESHGTFVCGQIRLVAPGCRLIPLKALGGNGVGNNFSIAKAIYHAIDSGAAVINLSLGTYEDSYLLRTACATASAAGITLVAAAGNDSTFLPIYPAAYPGVISVSAVDTLDEIAGFSNFGDSIDVCAPGVEMYSSLTGEYDWGTWSGTSFAAPLVSATCALVLALDPDMTGTEMEAYIRSTSEKELWSGTISPPDPLYGYGRVDASNAVWSINSIPVVDGCGDVNGDEFVNIVDAVCIINYVFFQIIPGPNLQWAGDVNADLMVNVSDAVYLLNYIFIAFSPEPNCPAE